MFECSGYGSPVISKNKQCNQCNHKLHCFAASAHKPFLAASVNQFSHVFVEFPFPYRDCSVWACLSLRLRLVPAHRRRSENFVTGRTSKKRSRDNPKEPKYSTKGSTVEMLSCHSKDLQSVSLSRPGLGCDFGDSCQFIRDAEINGSTKTQHSKTLEHVQRKQKKRRRIRTSSQLSE